MIYLPSFAWPVNVRIYWLLPWRVDSLRLCFMKSMMGTIPVNMMMMVRGIFSFYIQKHIPHETVVVITGEGNFSPEVINWRTTRVFFYIFISQSSEFKNSNLFIFIFEVFWTLAKWFIPLTSGITVFWRISEATCGP